MIDNTPEFILLDLENSGRRPPPYKASADEARDAVFSGRASLFEIQKTPRKNSMQRVLEPAKATTQIS